jgi:type II secretory pathway predicted ATPase ExeA/LysM repeat protein
MYCRHFGLDGPPFRFSPSAAVLYLGSAHRECLAALEWALIHDQCGFMLLVGETGTGKTTLLNAVLARRLRNLHLACVTNPRLSFQEIMRVVLPQLGVTSDERGKLELIQELERVIANQPEGHLAAIAIDEAQDLSDETLEDLRLLTNHVGSQDRALQIVLMGQPELLDRLAAHDLRQLRERISTKVRLLPLSPVESVAYVKCRLEAQHGTPQIFEPKALRVLVKAAAGIPRRLNVLCHNALLLAYSKDASKVTGHIAREVVKDFESIVRPSGLVQHATESRSTEFEIHPRRSLIRAAGACAAVAVIGLGSVSIPTVHKLAGAFARTATLIASSAPAIPEATSVSRAKIAAALGYTASTANASVTAKPSDSTESPNVPDFTTVQIHRGDTFHDLAAKYLGSKDRAPELIRANPQIRNPNVLYVGQTIYLPSTHINDQAREVR